MEYCSFSGEGSPSETIEKRLDVDIQLKYSNDCPIEIWFRYLDETGTVIEHIIPIDQTFDANLIYGGLMSLSARYAAVDNRLEAIRIGDDWYSV